MKARWLTLLTVLLCCSACGAPSLRHKQQVNKLLAQGEYASAGQSLESAKGKQYSRRDSLLYYLDTGAVLHAAGEPAASDEKLALAQERIEELFTQSLSAQAGRFLINDLTVPYYPAAFERSLTYYYRAMNFLDRNDVPGALVEANKAVYYLDGLRGSKRSGWRDDPFVQYFSSLVFESAGKRDDARIARARAVQAYGTSYDPFYVAPVQGWGEVIIVHENGVSPLKKSNTFQVNWDSVLLWAQAHQEGEDGLSPQVQNAIVAGLLGQSVTISYPTLEEQPYTITASEAVTAQGQVYPTRLAGNVAQAAEADLQEKELATLMRSAARAATKRVAAVQAKHLAQQSSGDKSMGDLAELVFSFLGAVTEKADTRQWFTLPAQFRLVRFYVPPGPQDILLRFKDGFGNIVGEHIFDKVPVRPGGRVYLHYRTAQ